MNVQAKQTEKNVVASSKQYVAPRVSRMGNVVEKTLGNEFGEEGESFDSHSWL
jgi:hypothetical protein